MAEQEPGNDDDSSSQANMFCIGNLPKLRNEHFLFQQFGGQ
jgi:hypothetical protein